MPGGAALTTLEGLVKSSDDEGIQRAAVRALAQNDSPRAHQGVRTLIERPDASEKPAGPRHLPFALAGILIGLIGASGVLLYFLVFRETLITVESVERIIGLPVVASVAVHSGRR